MVKNFAATNAISSSALTSASIQTSQLTINGKLESDTLHARKEFFVNSSLKLAKETAKSFAEVSTVDTAVALVLQRDTLGRGVGIGITPSVGEKLSVAGNAKFTGDIIASCVKASCLKVSGQTNFDNVQIAGRIKASIYASISPLIFEAPAGVERMRIDDVTGNAGIGINSPQKKLHIHNFSLLPQPVGMMFTSGNSTNGIGSTINDGFHIGILADGTAELGQKENLPMLFSTNNTEQMRITANGNVGIGTPAPQDQLHISGTGDQSIRISSTLKGSETRLMSVSSNNRTETQLQFIERFALVEPLSGAAMMTVLSNGNVGIGTSAPQDQLHISGTGDQSIRISSTLKGSETRLMSVSSNNRTETQLQFIQRFALVEPLSGMAVMTVLGNGKAYIGVDPIDVTGTHYELNVCGTIQSNEWIVQTGWCDFKLKPGYKRMTAEEKLSYILTYGHLPEMDSGSEIETSGLKVAKNLRGMAWNLEDNTMDIIDLRKENQTLKKDIDELKKQMQQVMNAQKK